MTDTTQRAIFARELERKFDELVAWAVEHNPDKSMPLSRKDFSSVRNDFCKTASTDPLIGEPEPEAGGAQYINDNPAPWP